MSEPHPNHISLSPTCTYCQHVKQHMVRDYLTSPAAERALAEALPEHEGCNAEAHNSCTAYAQAILAAWVASLEKAE